MISVKQVKWIFFFNFRKHKAMGWRRKLIFAALFITVYLNYPPPDQSRYLTEWHRAGKYFSFDGHKIFYRGGS